MEPPGHAQVNTDIKTFVVELRRDVLELVELRVAVDAARITGLVQLMAAANHQVDVGSVLGLVGEARAFADRA